jgi:hypothetical protein
VGGPQPVGGPLRRWRERRRLSQLELSSQPGTGTGLHGARRGPFGGTAGAHRPRTVPGDGGRPELEPRRHQPERVGVHRSRRAAPARAASQRPARQPAPCRATSRSPTSRYRAPVTSRYRCACAATAPSSCSSARSRPSVPRLTSPWPSCPSRRSSRPIRPPRPPCGSWRPSQSTGRWQIRLRSVRVGGTCSSARRSLSDHDTVELWTVTQLWMTIHR